MSQSALPNSRLFSSSWTQLIVTPEKLSFFQIYKTQNGGGGFGRELRRAADHRQRWDLPWLLSPSRQVPREAGGASRSLPPPAGPAPPKARRYRQHIVSQHYCPIFLTHASERLSYQLGEMAKTDLKDKPLAV